MGLLVAGLAGCATPMLMDYLVTAQDRATQEEVRKELGEPRKTFQQEDGRSIWIYHHISYNYNPPFGASSCVEYRLTFDGQRVLRQWDAKEWPPQNC
jgi:molybdenum cofactor biosynthesis enzyme MoaA